MLQYLIFQCLYAYLNLGIYILPENPLRFSSFAILAQHFRLEKLCGI